MEKEQHIHELIDQYLQGTLVGQELDKFKIKLKDDPTFEKQVQLQKAIIEEIEKSRNAELKLLLQGKLKKKKKAVIIPFERKTLAVAASVLSVLALGLVIKTMLPTMNETLSQKTENQDKVELKNNKVEDADDSFEVVTNSEQVTEDSVPAPPVEKPELLVVAEDDAEETLSDDVTFSDEPAEVDFSKLKKDEDVINGKDVKATRDSMLGFSSAPIWVYTENYPIKTVEEKEADEENSGILNRKKKTKDNNEVTKATTVTNESQSPVVVKSQSKTIRVEFWESIVNFKGYKYDGTKLLLFDTAPGSSVSLAVYNDTTYLKKDNVYYLLIPNGKFNQMARLTDPSILSILQSK